MKRNLKLHAKKELSYDLQLTGNVWTQCGPVVDASRIAAFPEGVTCKKCLAAIAWDAENAADWERRRAEFLATFPEGRQ